MDGGGSVAITPATIPAAAVLHGDCICAFGIWLAVAVAALAAIEAATGDKEVGDDGGGGGGKI